MKIKDGYLLKKVAGDFVIVPIKKGAFTSVMTLNETGAFLFEKISEGADETGAVKALLEEYNTNEQTALRDVRNFIAALSRAGVLEE